VIRPASDTVALVLVGNELLIGHTSDINGPWLGRRLTEAGLRVVAATIAPDAVDAVARAIGHGLEAARAVVVTGGLGPTADDVTRAALERLATGWLRTELANAVGSEPGVRLESQRGVVFAVPGVPEEMRSLVDRHVLPEIVASAGALAPRSSRSLVVVGLAEAQVAELLAPVEEYLLGQGWLAYLPHPAEIEVRFGGTGVDAEEMVTAAAARARELLGDLVAAEDQRLEEAVVEVLRTRRGTVSTAESLTGGLVAATLVSVPGASDVVRGGVVVYATELKAELLGVPADLLERDGAVAPTTARAMAEGVRARCRADFGVATTGVAGPDPQEGHQVGTMYLAVASRSGTRVGSFEPSGQRRDRQTVRRQAVVRALDLLRRAVLGGGPGPGESSPQPTR
jgi:nicotinamide-nucleotide amidase